MGRGGRDQAAAAVGRLYPRWPTEVRRLVAMAARLDPDRVDLVARRLADDAAARGHSGITEPVALDILGSWGLNRLGMNEADREALRLLVDGDAEASARGGDPDTAAFLAALGLVAHDEEGTPRLTKRGRSMGPEAAKP